LTEELLEKKGMKSMVDQIFIPFSDIFSQKIEEYIYSGGEKIPFRERHPIFQTLMLSEFDRSYNLF